MTTINHPTIERLSGYILEPGQADFVEIRQHLLSCPECRNQADQLIQLTQHSRLIGHRNSHNSMDDETLSDIADYVDGKLDETEKYTLERRFSQSKTSLKAALHYASHSSAMQSNIEYDDSQSTSSTQSTTTEQTEKQASIQYYTNKIKSAFSGWLNQKSSTWIAVPATAVLVFGITISLLSPISGKGTANYNIAFYQDKSVIAFTDSTNKRPGIGFFSNTPKQTKPFKLNSINLSADNTLRLQWPEITGAKQILVRISKFSDNDFTEIVTGTTKSHAIAFNNFNPELGRRYQWNISGLTDNNQSFNTSGGFVIN